MLAAALLLLVWGAISFHNLPVEAYPDVANNYVQMITQWPGRAAEEVEQQVTIPIEIVMNGIPHLEHLRSTSLFGLSSVTLIFDDESENDWNRQKVLERLRRSRCRPICSRRLGTDWSPVGQIYLYTLQQHQSEIRRDGAEVARGLGAREAVQVGAECRGCLSFGGTDARIPGTRRSGQADLLRTEHRPSGAAAHQQQRECRRKFHRSGLQQINVRALGLFSNVQRHRQTR